MIVRRIALICLKLSAYDAMMDGLPGTDLNFYPPYIQYTTRFQIYRRVR